MRALFIMLLAAACGDNCPDTPSGACQEGLHCQYDKQRCDCNMGWHCQDNVCPTDTIFPSGPCTAEGAECHYGFEDDCFCQYGQWKCVGGYRPPGDLAFPVEED